MTSQRFTQRLVLRPPKAEDLTSLFAIYGDPATHQFNPAGPLREISQAQTLLGGWLAHWQAKGFGQWAIATRDAADTVIGFGGIDGRMYLDIERLNLGYRFAVTAWGKGYATELSQAALDYALAELHAPDIFAVVRPTHLASIRVLEKIGMQRVESLDDVPGQPASYVYTASRAHRSEV